MNVIRIKFILLLFSMLLIGTVGFAETFLDRGVNYASPWWQVKAADGSNVLVIDNSGNMYIIAPTISLNTVPPSGLTNSLIVRTTGGNKFSFSSSAAYIAGTIYQSQASVDGGNGDDLVIKNNAGTIVARFDGGNGNIYLKGIANDVDRDGYILPADCDDLNSGRSPGVAEIYGNGIDEDCSGRDAYAVDAAPTAWTSAQNYCTSGGTVLRKYVFSTGSACPGTWCDSNRNNYVYTGLVPVNPPYSYNFGATESATGAAPYLCTTIQVCPVKWRIICN